MHSLEEDLCECGFKERSHGSIIVGVLKGLQGVKGSLNLLVGDFSSLDFTPL